MIYKLIVLILNKFLTKFPSFRQFIFFSLIGVINTAVDFFIYLILTRSFTWFLERYLFANGLAFLAAATVSYYLNKNFTFKDRTSNRISIKYIKYLIVSLATLILVEVILFILVSNYQIYDLYAKFIVILVSVISNFILSKFVVFKK